MHDWHAGPALLSILLATEDHPGLLPMTRALLGAGHVVHTVLQADLIVEATKRYKPDICVMHVGMLGRSCYAVAEELRRLPPSRRPILIALPGSSLGPNKRPPAQAAAFDHFFSQPADPAALLAFIDEIGTRRRAKKKK